MKVNVDAVNKISTCRDSCIALLALDCEHQGLTEISLNKNVWEEYLNTDALYGDQWLLAYEVSLKGWLKSKKDPMYVEKDPNFSFLKNQWRDFLYHILLVHLPAFDFRLFAVRHNFF